MCGCCSTHEARCRQLPVRVVNSAARASVLLVAAALAAAGYGAFAPLRFDSREEVFEIPQGTWARRQAGDMVDILPSEIHLVTGIRNVLVLRNRDDVPQIFGPTLIMPGQSFSLPFETAADYDFACTAHSSGQMRVAVAEEPRTPWARLRWRAQRLLRGHGHHQGD